MAIAFPAVRWLALALLMGVAAAQLQWTLTDVIESPKEASDKIFGGTIAVEGDVAVIGAPYGDGGDGDGRAFVYRRQNESPYTWRLEAVLEESGVGEGALYAASLHVRGGVVCVGAPGVDGGSGAAFVWEERGGEWERLARLEPDVREAGQYFGHACSVTPLGGVVVGAPYRDTEFGEDRGAVHAFERMPGAKFVHAQRIVVPNASDRDAFGFSLVTTPASPEHHPDLRFYLAVGAPYYDRRASVDPELEAVVETGAVYEYAQPEGIDLLFFVRIYENPSLGPLEQFGLSLSYSDEFLAVGAPRTVLEDRSVSSIDLTLEGAVYLYDRPGEDSFRDEPQMLTGADVYGVFADSTTQSVIVEEFGVVVALGEGSNALVVSSTKETFVAEDRGGAPGLQTSYEQRGAAYFFANEALGGPLAGRPHDSLERDHVQFVRRVAPRTAGFEAQFGGALAFADTSAAHVLVGLRGQAGEGSVYSYTCGTCASLNGEVPVPEEPEEGSPAPRPPPINVDVNVDVNTLGSEPSLSTTTVPDAPPFPPAPPTPPTPPAPPISPFPSSNSISLFGSNDPLQGPIVFEVSDSPAHRSLPSALGLLAAAVASLALPLFLGTC